MENNITKQIELMNSKIEALIKNQNDMAKLQGRIIEFIKPNKGGQK